MNIGNNIYTLRKEKKRTRASRKTLYRNASGLWMSFLS